MMKKRYFLQAGAAIVGTVWLSHYLTGRSQVIAIAKNQFEITKTEEEWRKILTPEQFSVLRKHGTESAGTSPLDHQYAKGTYVCVCGLQFTIVYISNQIQQWHRLAQFLRAY